MIPGRFSAGTQTITILMDILYTTEEKYLEALEELNYGEPQKALHLLNEIIQIEPDYARAYYHLGDIYQDKFKNYQTAGYYYKKCMELEPEFPDVYLPYLRLLATLEMPKLADQIFTKALLVKGVCKCCVYEQMGKYAEQERRWDLANELYKQALLSSTGIEDKSSLQDNLQRLKDKKKLTQKVIYNFE